MDSFNWPSFVLGAIVGILACVSVSDLVFPNSELNWDDEDDVNPL